MTERKVIERQFIYNSIVGISENYISNFFDIAILKLETNIAVSIIDREICLEMINEKCDLYNQVERYAISNIDERDIYIFTSKLEELLRSISYKYIGSISLLICDIFTNNNTLKRDFNF